MGVFPCVLEHFLGDRSLSPVSELVLLVSDDSAVALQQVCQAEALLLKDSGCLPGVKHVYEVKTEVLLEPFYVVVGTVKNLGFRRIVENGEQLFAEEVSELDSVYDEVMSASRDLHEASETLEGSSVVMLQIYS